MKKIDAKRKANDIVLEKYLEEINSIDLLSREEEDEIARKAAKGDRWAREKLITANLRFVVSVAKKYQGQGLPLSDLISEGNIGLMNAINKYDPDRGYHFISYAVWWIRQAVLKAICEKSRMIRLPLNRVNELVQIQKVRKQLQSDKQTEAKEEEIASVLGMDKDLVNDLESIARDHVSLDTPVLAGDKESSSLGSLISDDGIRQPDEPVIDEFMKLDINNLLETLSDKESDILQHRFGLNGRKALSLKEVGDRYKLTKERIRQIEKKALEKLRETEETYNLKAYIA